MTTATKIILIIIIWFIVGMFITLIGEASGSQNSIKPFAGIAALGLFAASRAIWKYQPEKKEESKDIDKLDKN